MAEKIVFESVAPVVPVLDLDAALDRYRRLGFMVRRYDGLPYGFVDRDGVSLHLGQWAEHDPKRTAAHVYLYVSDADASMPSGPPPGSTVGSARCTRPTMDCASSRSLIQTERCIESAHRFLRADGSRPVATPSS